MANLPSEAGAEYSILTWLDNLGWETYGHDRDRGAEVLDRKYERAHNEVIYWDILKAKLIEFNEEITADNVDRLLNSLKRDLAHDHLLKANQQFHQLLRGGKKFKVTQSDGSEEYIYVDLIDHQEIGNNRFIAANQFTVRQKETKRPDVNLFVNGIPIVTMELKSSAQDNDYWDAIQDLHELEDKVSRFFVPGLLNIAGDSLKLVYGAVGAPTEFYQEWNEAPPKHEDENPMKQAVQALLNPRTLLDLLDNFVFYEEHASGDAKIVPRYMQYYAVNELLDRVRQGQYKRGLIWHTQGSGKSYTMLYAAHNLLNCNLLDNPQILVIVDTDKLRNQMKNTLAKIGFDRWEVAESMDHLQQLLDDGKSTLVLTTIQMFEDVDPHVQTNQETVVMADEAHRFLEKDLGSKLEAALPDAYYFGFTGTPVREDERDTFANFAPDKDPSKELYLHRYSIGDGIKDGLILPVHFSIRRTEWEVDEEALDVEFEEELSEVPTEKKQKIIKDAVTAKQLAELPQRVRKVVEHIVDHFENHPEPNGWKGMLVTPSRKAAALYGQELLRHREEDDVEVLITSNKNDNPLLRRFQTDPEERDQIVRRFKDEDQPKLLVVCDMLLTGFDAPVLKTMYLDRNLKDHNLLQAIARTNRPAQGKNNGEIVDFQGVFANIDEALDYDQEVRQAAAIDREELFEEFEQELETLWSLFQDVEKVDTQEALREAVTLVEKEHTREFKQGYRHLQDLYETLSPDKRLVETNAREKYQWLNRVYVAYRRHTNRNDRPQDQLREKTRRILEEHVDVGEILDQFPKYEISEEHLEKVEDLEPAAQATEIAHATREHLQPRTDRNPRYKRLSERLNDVLSRWHQGTLDDAEASDKLRRIEEETLQVEEEKQQSGLEDAEFALYTALTEEYGEHIEDKAEARAIAEAIGEAFEEQIDTNFEGWDQREGVLQDIRRVLITTVVSEFGKMELYDAGFVIEAREYLVENVGANDA
jgi:type I restriction enzyme R subunit